MLRQLILVVRRVKFKRKNVAGSSQLCFVASSFCFWVASSPPVPVLVPLATSLPFQHRVCCAAALGFLNFPTSRRPPFYLSVAAQAQPSGFQPGWLRSKPILGYASHQRRVVTSVFSAAVAVPFLPGSASLTTQSRGPPCIHCIQVNQHPARRSLILVVRRV